jgi:hypothetical protein
MNFSYEISCESPCFPHLIQQQIHVCTLKPVQLEQLFIDILKIDQNVIFVCDM